MKATLNSKLNSRVEHSELKRAMLDEIELMKLGLSDFTLHMLTIIISKGDYCTMVSTVQTSYSANGELILNMNRDFGSQPIEIFEKDGDLREQALDIGFKEAKSRGIDFIRFNGTFDIFLTLTREAIDLRDFLVQ